MTNGMIDLKQIELHFEKANNGGSLAERGMAMAVTGAIEAGLALLAAKDIVPHGEWELHRGRNWMYGKDTAVRYMRIASNVARVPDLKDAPSVRHALRMIAEENKELEPETAPRSKRKTGQVEVVKPAPVVKESVTTEPDDDPTPDPPTIRTTPAGTTRPREADRTPPAVITPEILPDETDTPPAKHWPDVSLEELIEGVISKLDHDKQRKAAAKTLRKLADKLDPPKKAPSK